MADSPYFDATYFDPDYFDTDAATSGGSGGNKRMRIRVEPPALIEEVTDDGWIHIIL